MKKFLLAIIFLVACGGAEVVEGPTATITTHNQDTTTTTVQETNTVTVVENSVTQMKPTSNYSCNLIPLGFCIFTGIPHQTGLKPGTNEIINREIEFLFLLEEAVAVDSSGKILEAKGTPAFEGDELIQSDKSSLTDDERAFHHVMAIMFPIRNALMYDIGTLSASYWEILTYELAIRGIKDTTFTEGKTPKDNYYGREGIYDLAKNPGGKDIHHDIMKFLEESGLYLLCHVTSDEFNEMLKETHPENHDPCKDAGIENKISFNETTISEDESITESSKNYLSDYTLFDDLYGTKVTVSISNGVRTIVSNAIPNHSTGNFPNSGNPNEISEQSKVWNFPVIGTYTGVASNVREPGVALNGIKFEPGTAETVTCDSGEVYRVEGLQNEFMLGMDFNNAHVQPSGEYHYHGISPLLVEEFEENSDLVLIGFAKDGFLIYYSKSNSYKSSYKLSTDFRIGNQCKVSLNRLGSKTFNLSETVPDGTYTSDWIFTPNSGLLDECNGTIIADEYSYIVTDSFPFIPRCLMGEFNENRQPNR